MPDMKTRDHPREFNFGRPEAFRLIQETATDGERAQREQRERDAARSEADTRQTRLGHHLSDR